MARTSSSLTARLGVHLLGVQFFWDGMKARFDNENLQESGAVHKQILELVREPMRRQKRSHIAYWDAMTFLELGSLPTPLAKTQEAELAAQLVLTIGADKLRDRTVQELIDLPVMDHVHASLAYDSGEDGRPGNIVVSRTNPARVVYGADGRLRTLGPGFYRSLEIDLAALGVDPQGIDWYRLVVLAVLIQIRADLELEAETGFRRVRKCQRRACGAWFMAKRMAGRQRFCCAVCRASNPRESLPPRRRARQ
ncbi:MAG: hypothetical protein IH889_06715 [Planctomycetes bacterium]|nr:hypothetical protein [Planctomycetota bacterium]